MSDQSLGTNLGHVDIFEMGPRDGLQNEKIEVSVGQKIALINCLSRAGYRRIECASFVSPKWVPQMAGSADVLGRISRADGVRYAALTPNMRGFNDAKAANADEVAVFGSASEAFSKANINVSIDESLDQFEVVIKAARTIDMPVRGYVSCVAACPFEGEVDPSVVARVAERLFSMGCYEVSLGDTIGVGTPDTIAKMLIAVRDLSLIHI